MKILSSRYSDDADPAPEGININLFFYDSKSEGVIIKNVPMTVEVKLTSVNPATNVQPSQELYAEVFTISTSGFSDLIRIPYKQIHTEQTTISETGLVWAKIRVTIPNQKSLEAISQVSLRR